MRSRVMTLIDCGVSITGASVLVAVTARSATKPRTGPVAVSWTAAPGTVTAGSCGAGGVTGWARAAPDRPSPSTIRGRRKARVRGEKRTVIGSSVRVFHENGN